MRVRTTFLLLGFLAAAPLAAQEPPRGEPQGAERRGPLPGRLLGPLMGPAFDYAPSRLIARREALGLTPEQVQRLESLAQEVRRARGLADSTARARRQRIEQIWREATPDASRLRTEVEAVMQAWQRAALTALTAAAEAKAVLTPEQRGRVSGWADARRGLVERRWHRIERIRERRLPRGLVPPRRPGLLWRRLQLTP